MKKRVTIIFLTLLFTILAFGKVDLYAETTDEGTQLEETTLSEPASETEDTKEEPEETPQEEIDQVKETVEEVKETEKIEDTNETVEEERPQVEDKTKEKSEESVEGSEDQPVSDAKEHVDLEESKEEEITKDEKAEEKPETEVQEGGETEAEEKAENEGQEKSEEKAEEKIDDSEEAKEAEKTDEETEGETVLEEGEVLEVSELAENPLALGQGQGGDIVEITVIDFEGLKAAIDGAEEGKTTKIIIKNEIIITGTLTIQANRNIILTSGADRGKENNKVTPIGQDRIEMPKSDDSMDRRQDLVKDAETKGEEALTITDLSKNHLPTVDYVLKRGKDFEGKDFKGTLIEIQNGGTLTLGADKEDPLFIDGNKDVQTEIEGGSFIEVSGTLVINGGTIANGKNYHYSSAPIYVNQGGEFTMNGGRITSNENISYDESKFDAAGGVYVAEGGEFTLKAGSIDNNYAPVGGVFLGRIMGNKSGKRIPAKFTMNGGYITRNIGPKFADADPKIQYYGGGVHVDSLAKFELNDGIIAGNVSYHGGGVAITDNYVEGFSLATTGQNNRYSKVNTDSYENYVSYAGANYTQNGGLIYKNTAKLKEGNIFTGAGGALYINSSTIYLNEGFILNNKSEHEGGGIYLSIAPQKLTLKQTLITKNKAVNYRKTLNQFSPGQGGGYWNCPVGSDIIEDFHSLYIFENEALYGGDDIYTSNKYDDFKINDEDQTFKTRISPITEKGNIINYKDDRKEGIPDYIYYTNKPLNIKAYYDDATKEEAWTNSKFFIIGNESDRGGGIGSNADIYAPGNPKNNKVIIEKIWDKSVPEDKIPESIWVDLFIGDAKYAEVELGKKNNWTYKFENLPFTSEELAAKGLKYQIKEKNSDFYSVVNESFKDLEVERIWLNKVLGTFTYDPKPNDKSVDEKLIFVYKDKDGKEISRQDLIIKNFENDLKRWTGKVNGSLFNNFTNKNIKITYYGLDKSENYFGEPWKGFEPSKGSKTNGPWLEVYVVDNGDGSVNIQLPYIYTQRLESNPYSIIEEYDRNKTGYRVNLIHSHRFTITNYPYSEIPIEKNWDKSIKEEDIPDSINVYLLKDGKRFVDEDGKDRVVTLSKANGWKGVFEKLPYFNIPGMSFEHYWVKEDSEIFIPLVKAKEKPMLDIFVDRIQELDNGYKIDDEDYAGGVYRIEYIPFEVHHGNKVDKFNLTFHPNNPQVLFLGGPVKGEKSFLADIELPKDKSINIRTYYDEDGKPFPRNLGKYEGYWAKDPGVNINPGAYVLKLVEEDGKLVLYVPKLTPKEWNENLLDVKANVTETKPYFELTNYYQPKHRLEIEKKWDTEKTDLIPKTLRVKINGKYVDKEITLSPEEWKYMEEFLGKGIISANSYSFSEEDLEKFDGKQSIETTMEFEAENKTLSFKDDKGNSVTKEEFLKMIQGKNYSFELKEADDEKAEVEIKYDADGKLVIVYPVDVTITEVAHVLFTNTEKPEEPPEEPKESKTYVRVSKVWEALGETQAIRVQLYVNGEATNKFLTLSEANGWTATFYDLDEYDFMGNRYTYTVREVGDENGLYKIGDREFEVSYAGNMDKGFTITNKEIPPEEPEEPDEPEPEESEEPEEPEDEGGGENIIPKTGVKTDVKSIYLSLILLIALVVLKRKKYSK